MNNKETRYSKTTCPLDCYDTCGMIASIQEERVIQVKGDPEHPVTKGRLCVRGHGLVDRTNSKKRLLYPLKRVNGQWEEISWEKANQEIAQYIESAIDHYGQKSIMHSYDYGSSGLLKLLCDRFFHMLGGFTETTGSICWGAGLAAQEYDFGIAQSHDPEDLTQNSKTIVLWGRNAAVTNVHLVPYLRSAKMRGANLVIINSLPSELDAIADTVIQPKPGTDGILALGVCNLLFEKGLLQIEELKKYIHGLETFKNEVARYTLETVSAICEIDKEMIERLSCYYRETPVATILGIGLQRRTNGGNIIRAIDALAAVSGQVGLPGGGVHFANREVLSLINWDYILYGSHRSETRAFSRVSQAADILTADPPVEVLFVSRTNLVSQLPDSNQTRRALDSVPVVIVIDSFLTQTCDYADYVLPSTMFFEEEDSMITTMWNPYMGYANKVTEPIGESKPDWVIFRDLARVLGLPAELEIEPEEVIYNALKHWMSKEEFDQFKTVGHFRYPTEMVAYASRKFQTPSGKIELYSERALQNGDSAMASFTERKELQEYPYHLLSVHPKWRENSQQEEAPRPVLRPIVEVGLRLAEELGIQAGDELIVETSAGSLRCKAMIVAGMRSDVVRVEQGWSSGSENINLLTYSIPSDLGDGSAQYDCFCKLRKVASGNTEPYDRA